MMSVDPNVLVAQAKRARKRHRRLYQQLQRLKPAVVDRMFRDAHEQAFSCIDCMACANCCRSVGPLFTRGDIERLSAHLGLKPGVFFERYLRIDEDDDCVLQSVPCPFLDLETNACTVYEQRPKACREYPHTDASGQQKLQKLTLTNASHCPAVPEVLRHVAQAAERQADGR
jgi:Fe-S-cluster containining protein